MEIRRLVVVAATYVQYSQWCHEHRISPRNHRVLYVDDLVKLRGLGPIRYVWLAAPMRRHRDVVDGLRAYLQRFGRQVDDAELADFCASIAASPSA